MRRSLHPPSPVRVPILLLPVLLAACASTPPAAPAPTAAASAPATQPDDALRGQILLPPGSSLPVGGRLQLVLADRFPGNPDTPPLAAAERPLPATAPLPFELPFARAQVRDISVYRLDVAIFDAAGRMRFVSDGEHPVNLGEEAEPTRIELMAVATEGQQSFSYDCGGVRAEVRLIDPDLFLDVPLGRFQLRRAHAASGSRYIGGDAELWSKGEQARIQLGPQTLHCQRLP